MDALAFEGHFLDHLAPVWRFLAPSDRGSFRVDPALVDRAARHGIEVVATDRPEHVERYPSPRRDGPPALVASYGDMKEARRLGYGPFAFLEHGAGQTYGNTGRPNGSYSGGPDRADNELILVPNRTCAAVWNRTYPAARVEIVGCPKLDDLPRREPGPSPVIAVSFHWPAPLGISGYAGTAVGEYQQAVGELAKRYTVIGHAHPKGDWPQRMQRTYVKYGIPFVADFTDVCRQADLYVCDNSSTIYEFAATGRPVVLLNSRFWHRQANLGLRFWDAAHVGINVNRPEDLASAVETALVDPPEQQAARADALSIAYEYLEGGAQRAAAVITDWLRTRQAVAA